MTEKLYYIDSHLREFEAMVLSCEEGKKGFLLELDRTAFFPEGGGQMADTGTSGEASARRAAAAAFDERLALLALILDTLSRLASKALEHEALVVGDVKALDVELREDVEGGLRLDAAHAGDLPQGGKQRRGGGRRETRERGNVLR